MADETDLLIRSTSSILSLIAPQVSEPTPAGKDSGRMNRIALLFDTELNADVALVIAAHVNSVSVLAVQESVGPQGPATLAEGEHERGFEAKGSSVERPTRSADAATVSAPPKGRHSSSPQQAQHIVDLSQTTRSDER